MLNIDTAAANRPYILRTTTISTSAPSPALNVPQSTEPEQSTPLLSSFLGANNAHSENISHLDAPPSYLEATTPGLYSAQRYSTGDEGARLLPFDGRARTPVGVDAEGQLADPLEGMYKGPSYRRRSLRERCSKGRVWKWVAAILVIIVLVGVLAAVTRTAGKETAITPAPAGAESGRPVLSFPTEGRDDYPIRWPARCGQEYKVKTEDFDFGSPSELHIEEYVHQRTGSYKRVAGWIHVVRAPAEQPAGTIRAKFAYAVTPSVGTESITYEASSSGLVIGEPSLSGVLDGAHRSSECLGMSVVVYVAPGTELENLNIKATHMGMQVHEGVDFAVSNTTSIALTTGTLDASSFNSRETRLETVAGSISGKHALYDLLYVKTVSGSVMINVEPKEGTSKGTVALFQAQSQSGSIRTDFERKRIPERDYQVSIATKVGSIDGTFIHGSRTSIQSVAGSITADILPFKAGDFPSVIETDSRSGETHIELQSAYQPTALLNKLTSTHKTISGAIDLTYPQEWEGHLDGSAVSGAIHLQGKDLELIDEVSEPGKNHVEARKGKGSSELTFSTVSGRCEVRIGDL